MSTTYRTGPAATGPNLETVKKIDLSQHADYTTSTNRKTRITPRERSCLDMKQVTAHEMPVTVPALAQVYKLILHWESMLLATVFHSRLPVLDYLPADIQFFGAAHRELIRVIRRIDPSGAEADLVSVFGAVEDCRMVNAVVLSGIYNTGGLLATPGYIRDFCAGLVVAQDAYERGEAVAEDLERVLRWGVYYAYSP